jgi:hypothetical protein
MAVAAALFVDGATEILKPADPLNVKSKQSFKLPRPMDQQG